MRDDEPSPVWMSLLITHLLTWTSEVRVKYQRYPREPLMQASSELSLEKLS